MFEFLSRRRKTKVSDAQPEVVSERKAESMRRTQESYLANFTMQVEQKLAALVEDGVDLVVIRPADYAWYGRDTHEYDAKRDGGDVAKGVPGTELVKVNPFTAPVFDHSLRTKLEALGFSDLVAFGDNFTAASAQPVSVKIESESHIDQVAIMTEVCKRLELPYVVAYSGDSYHALNARWEHLKGLDTFKSMTSDVEKLLLTRASDEVERMVDALTAGTTVVSRDTYSIPNAGASEIQIILNDEVELYIAKATLLYEDGVPCGYTCTTETIGTVVSVEHKDGITVFHGSYREETPVWGNSSGDQVTGYRYKAASFALEGAQAAAVLLELASVKRNKKRKVS